MKHILLVDDEPEVVEGLQQILSTLQDVEIHASFLASQALQLVEQLPVSLVIADIRMPGMNGIEMWEAVRLRRPSCRVIFLSGVRDFDHIYRIIQNPSARFLTKMEPEEKILAAVKDALMEIDSDEKTKAELQSRFLHTYLTSSGPEQNTAYRDLSALSGPIDFSQSVSFVCFNISHTWAMSHSEQRSAIERLIPMVQSLMGSSPYHMIRLHRSCALWIFQSSAGNLHEDLLASSVRSLCTRLSESQGILLSCVYSSDVTSLQALHERYRYIADAPMLTDVPISQVLSIDEFRSSPHCIPKELLQKLNFNLQVLKGHLSLGQKENFLSTVQNICAACAHQSHSNVAIMLYFSILSLLYQQLAGHDAETLRARIRNEQAFPVMPHFNWEEKTKALLSFSHDTFELLFPSDPYAHPEVIKSIQQYIHDHLDKDLSLNALSSRFNISANYLSRLFRENTGHKLHDYIVQHRLGTAEHLLRTSGLRINEIATQVGYESVHTFIRAFRKQFHTTPAEYRNMKSKT